MQLYMKTRYISVGANCHPYASDWNAKHGLLAYGAHSMIALWYKDSVLCTLKGHSPTSVVTSVRFVSDSAMVSGSQDGNLRCWTISASNTGGNASKFGATCVQSITGNQTKSITALASCDEGRIIASCCSDGTVCLYRLQDSESGLELSLFDTIRINDRFIPMSVAITKIGSKYLLAVGGSSNNVFLLTSQDEDSNKYSVEATLVGHENWVRGLDFKHFGNNSVTLATASQDRYIRLWRIVCSDGSISTRSSNGNNDKEADIFMDMETTLLSNKVYSVFGGEYSVTFEALLMGHDDWIVSVAWDPRPEVVRLLSASSDTTLMVWEPDAESGIWMTCAQLGDVSIKGASTATGASGGFWRALWLEAGANSSKVATLGKTGSWRVWTQSAACTEEDQRQPWTSAVGITGHVKPVTDVSWGSAQYLLSTSLDQTTKLYAQWSATSQWYEMGRPQIHGYDMLAIKSITPSLFVSAGDEKTVRAFEKPQGVASMLQNVSNIECHDTTALAKSAMVPALGLSNRVEDESSDATVDTLSHLTHPPFENILQRQTLWPEHEKLYGHGYEISCLDVTHDHQILATCCRANNEKHAVVRLYNITDNWLQITPPLSLHGLTVTRLRFSPDDSRLLTVSRDRQIGVWIRTADGYALEQAIKGHSRIIWDCAWLSNTQFATSSRDKSVKLWSLDTTGGIPEWKETAQHKFCAPVTALDCHMALGELAIGLEDGKLYTMSVESLVPIEVDSEICPASKINRLQYCPLATEKILAVASDDTALRLYVP